MYREAWRNPDGRPLEADHSIARSLGGTKADRLLLSTCNRSRGNGLNANVQVNAPRAWWSRPWL